MTTLLRGRIYRVRLPHVGDEKYFLVVSNNQRNRYLDSVLAVRFTTSPKPSLPSIVEVSSPEVLAGGRIVCDDIYEIFEEEVREDVGAVSPRTMAAVERGLLAALGMN